MDSHRRTINHESRHGLKNAVFEVLGNLLRDNDPPETRETLGRLKAAGYSDRQAKKLMAAVLAKEIFDVLGSAETVSMERYIAHLRRLPELPGK